MTENEKDIDLLRTQPKELIVKYQSMIEAIIAYFTESGLLKAADFEDHRQNINLKLLDKLPHLQTNYNGAAQFRTYLSAIVRNMCRELYRRGNRGPVTIPLEECDIPNGDSAFSRYEIEYACRRLSVIFSLYHSERPKLELCLKIHFRLPVSREDVQHAFPYAGWHELKSFLAAFNKNDSMLEYEIYAVLTPWINNFEAKENSPETLRTWVDKRIVDILRLLNGDPPIHHFTRKPLKILLEKFFSPEKSKT